MTTGRHQIKTMCPMNCHPTQCGMLVEVEHQRVMSIKGDPENPDSRGFLCSSTKLGGKPAGLLPVSPLSRDYWDALGWIWSAPPGICSCRWASRCISDCAASTQRLYPQSYGLNRQSHDLRQYRYALLVRQQYPLFFLRFTIPGEKL
jgi:Molybdopterin oxidoreductase Fe4S4 domain